MAATAADTTDASTAGLALAEANINWERLDKTKFHVIGAILFTAQQGVLHPTAVVKTRMQVAEGGLSQMSGFAVFRKILRSDGIPGAFRGFGTTAVGALPGRVLALTSLEMSKEMAFKYSEHFDMSETSRIAVANGVAGLVSSIFSSSYFVPLDVICQRLMVQGLPGMQTYRGPFDVINKVVRTEGLRGLYRGFGITMLTQSPASALWWSSYGGAQHAIWRSLGYGNHTQKKPSQTELVAVQATAGTIAGACSSIITTPIDTIKTRLQPTRRAPAIAPPTTTSFSTLPTTLHAVAGVEASLAMEADVAAAMVVTATEEVATAATTKATVATAPTREAATTATVVTTRGGVYGHDALRCYQRFNHGIQPETGASSSCIAHYNANDQYTSDPNWYLDSGATDHMTNDLERLHTHKNYRGNEQIQVANGSHHEGNSTSR